MRVQEWDDDNHVSEYDYVMNHVSCIGAKYWYKQIGKVGHQVANTNQQNCLDSDGTSTNSSN